MASNGAVTGRQFRGEVKKLRSRDMQIVYNGSLGHTMSL